MIEQLLSTGPRNQKLALFLLMAMYAAGVIGLSFENTRDLFIQLTPFNLLLTAAIIFHFEEEKKPAYFLFIILTAVLGFLIEVVGVSTGKIFGEYSYGATLGFQVMNVPLAIGLNWAILIYITGFASNALTSNFWLRCILGALMMTALDLFIEPVAIAFDFWSWQAGEIPLQNYIGWFVTALCLHFLFQKLPFSKNNPLAIKLLYIMSLFFAVLSLI